MGNSLPVYTIIFFFLITWNSSPIIPRASPYHWTVSWPSEKIDCKLLKAVPGKWPAIQFSPRSYKRLDGTGDDISEIIKKNNDMLLWLGTYFLHADITSCNTASYCSDKERSSDLTDRQQPMLQRSPGSNRRLSCLPPKCIFLPSSQGRGGHRISSEGTYPFRVWRCNTHLITWDPQWGERPLRTS